MMTMIDSAARHMAAGVEDLDELARLVEPDTGKVPSREALRSYRTKFRKYGDGWVNANRARTNEASKRRYAENPEKARRWETENPAQKLLKQCRKSAKDRGHECTITAKMIEAMLEPRACSITGFPLTWEHDGDSVRNPWAPSIDRLDNAIGYVPGNVRVVCWAFNQMRADWPDEVVSTLADAVLNPLVPAPSRRADPAARVHGYRPAKYLLKSCRGSAKRRALDFTLTVEVIEAMLKPMTCAATGLPLTWKRDGGSSTRANPWAPSIDRIDCSLGYAPGNVRVVCWAFNQMRGDFPDEVVRTLAEAIVSRRPAP